MTPTTPPGQQKIHRVNNADHTPVADTGNGEGYMTQEQWVNRDKSLGLYRVDEDGQPIVEPQ